MSGGFVDEDIIEMFMSKLENTERNFVNENTVREVKYICYLMEIYMLSYGLQLPWIIQYKNALRGLKDRCERIIYNNIMDDRRAMVHMWLDPLNINDLLYDALKLWKLNGKASLRPFVCYEAFVKCPDHLIVYIIHKELNNNNHAEIYIDDEMYSSPPHLRVYFDSCHKTGVSIAVREWKRVFWLESFMVAHGKDVTLPYQHHYAPVVKGFKWLEKTVTYCLALFKKYKEHKFVVGAHYALEGKYVDQGWWIEFASKTIKDYMIEHDIGKK